MKNFPHNGAPELHSELGIKREAKKARFLATHSIVLFAPAKSPEIHVFCRN